MGEHEREHAYEDIKRDVAEHKENNDNHARASAAPPTLAGAPPAGSHQQGEHQHENLGGDTKYADQAYQVDGKQEHYDIVMSRPEHEREHAYEEIKREVADRKATQEHQQDHQHHQHENLGGDTKYADQAYQVDGKQEHYDIVMSRPEHEREHAYEDIKRDVAEHKENNDNHARAPAGSPTPAGSHQQEGDGEVVSGSTDNQQKNGASPHEMMKVIADFEKTTVCTNELDCVQGCKKFNSAEFTS